MLNCSRSIELDATPEEVWAVIGRYMQAEQYCPLVVSVEALTTGEDGVGSKRRNFFENGTSITEKVIEWTPNRGQLIECSEFGSIPFRRLIAQIDIVPSHGKRTTLKWALDFQVKFGPLGWLLGQLVMKRAFGKIVMGNLDAIAERIAENRTRTDDPVGLDAAV
ncbi:hypothetical protein NBRC116601_27610 [Cognatishimia sp. WU-CL00825]|uniref:SRPBCC family protein n=1 Tax=Cognatishimia sp. WU-CL00825 TaxID=3127658 RepID=UPI003106CD4D